MPADPATNLYVHVPFCVSKCRYCAFHSETGADAERLRAFVRLLPREIALRRPADAPPPRTVYLGGGTPSLLGGEGLAALLAALPRSAEGAEVSVELNPGDVTPALAAALPRLGITRASLGVQSFSDRALRWLGRRHDAACARAAFAMLRAAGVPVVSLDLIAALPGEPAGEWRATLAEAAALAPAHASVYPLSVEPGTPLARVGVVPPSDEVALAAVAEAESVLGAAGLERYEISNYARPDFECRHNLAVWRGEDYLGVGPAAHSREGLRRRANEPSFDAWRAALEAGRLPPAETAELTPDEDESERFATRVRLARWRGPDPATPAGCHRLSVLEGLAKNGIVRSLGGGDWTLTSRGREVADAVMSELL